MVYYHELENICLRHTSLSSWIKMHYTGVTSLGVTLTWEGRSRGPLVKPVGLGLSCYDDGWGSSRPFCKLTFDSRSMLLVLNLI